MKCHDVAIAGGGVVGAALALGLVQRGFRVALIDKNPHLSRWPVTHYDVRASSINRASVTFFEQLNVWSAMQSMRVNAFREIHVWDATGGGSIHFDSADIGEPCLGYIIEHHVIAEALYTQLRDNPWFTDFSPDEVIAMELLEDCGRLELASGRQVRARLVVGADGSRSRIRELAGIESQAFAQLHHAVVATVGLSRPHDHTAWQRFLPDGPLAFLPLNEQHSSIVWSLPQERAEQMLYSDESTFCAALSEAMDHRFGALHLAGARAGFPLRPQHAKQYTRPRLCLAGDAAHSIHPLAGQGVNLGLLDAATLIEVLMQAAQRRKDPGDYGVLRRYERWRKGHNLAMLQIMQGFAHVFGSRDSLIVWIRNRGLNWTDCLPPVKQQIMQLACGLRGDLPPLASPRRTEDAFILQP